MKKLALLLGSLTALVASAAEFTLKKSVHDESFDWREGSNYEGGEAPSEGDYVIIPKDVNAKVAHGDEWWDFVSALGRIRPTTETSYFTVSIPANVTNSLACEITNTGANTSDSQKRGGLVKVGAGTLEVSITQYGYYTAFTVSEGNVVFKWRDLTKDKCCLDSLTVASGCVVDIASPKALVLRKFFGSGEITSSVEGILQTFSSDTVVSDFSGKLSGNLKFNSSSIVYLRGTESTKTGASYALGEVNGRVERGARLAVAKLGNKGDTGSIGPGDILYFGQGSAAASGLLYLGNGETSDRNLRLQSSSYRSFPYIDGGANGNLTLTGELDTSKHAKHNNRFALCGSNVTECVFGTKMIEGVDTNGNHVSYHIVKRGSGTWKLDPRSDSTWAGALSVEEGTIKYDSLEEAGVFCALGYATNLFEQYTGKFENGTRVDWAISLGTGDGKEGALEYSGTDGVVCSTRPIALKGNGRICQNVQKPFRFSGISSEGETAKTLTLDGTGTAGNEISGISDADSGAISVVKEGTGTWTLTAVNSFSGSLCVNQGTLNVCAPNWNWFKFVDRQGFTNSTANCTTPGKGFYVREMAFFNADGVSQTVGTTFVDSLGLLAPGTFTLANKISYEVQTTTAYPNASWNSLFNDLNEPAKIGFSSLKPEVNKESSWAHIVVRLPENAEPISSFDYVWALETTKSGCNTCPSYYTIMGSFDGFEWTELFSTNYAHVATSGQWVSSNTKYDNGYLVAARTNSKKAHHGVELLQPDSTVASPIDSASCVSVASGATLKCLYGTVTLDSFCLDMASGGGTVEGFAFADTGALYLTGVDTDSGVNQWEKSFNPENCTGVTNLSGWTLYVNGSETSKHSVSVTAEGKVRLFGLGLRVIIR